MTRSQTIYRKQLLALIHTNDLFKEIKANDAWEMWLSMRFGVTSAAKLSIDELKIALEILRGKRADTKDGFNPDFKGRSFVHNDASKITMAQVAQIEHLIKNLGWDEKRAVKFYYHQTGVLITNLNVISKKNATKIITGLKKIAKI